MSKRWIGRIAALALLLASASAVAGAFSKTYERIPGWDGAQMGALVLVPQGQGAGPFPLIVMPASCSLPNLEYLGRATQLASDGYVVVSHTSRGFWDSAGQINIAGPDTVDDVSAVIDWALAHTSANPNAIGASGISYGAGISRWRPSATRASRQWPRSAVGPIWKPRCIAIARSASRASDCWWVRAH